MTGSTSNPKQCPTRWARLSAVGMLLFAGAVGLQWLGGAYQAEFGSHPDEAAHYVTGLVVRDYVAAGLPGNPLTYAKEYYQHYPKVALGHWPPVFYGLQSAWTLVFTPGPASVLLLMALLTALAALTLFSVLRSEFDIGLAWAGAVLLLALPLVQQAAAAVMTEIPVTLFVLLATVAFGRYLERERTADALAFGLLASLAILTKFSGFVLALVPPVAVLLSRKTHLFKRASFWWPVVVVAVLCGPWTLLTLKLANEGMSEESWGWGFTHRAVPYYFGKLHAALGAGLLLLAALGVGGRLFARRAAQPPSGLWPAAGALLAGVMLVHLVVPCGFEARHLTPALPAAVLFAIAGADSLARWLTRRGVAAPLALLATVAAAAAAFGGQTFELAQKGWRGFGPVAESLLHDPRTKGAVFLISSDARGEGMFIAAVAMRERRPGHIIRRGSKELASSSWSGSGYKSRFADETSLREYLRTNSIGWLVLDTSLRAGARKDYHDLLRQAVDTAPASYQLEGSFPVERAGLWQTNGLRLYRFLGHALGH